MHVHVYVFISVRIYAYLFLSVRLFGVLLGLYNKFIERRM